MDPILGVALQGMQQDMARMERISANVANATTPGYRRELVIGQPIAPGGFAARMGALDASITGLDAGTTGTADAASGQTSVQLDTRAGTLKSTGLPLDLAIAGRGFFEVRTDTGLAYTRQGSFQVDARGRLVTAQGLPVMGEGGELILRGSRPTIDAKGNVLDGDQTIGRLKLVVFTDERSMQRLGDGLLGAGSGQTTPIGAETLVQQGYLENANVSTLSEMTQMIQTARHFEAMQRLAQGFDEMTGSAIRRLSEV